MRAREFIKEAPGPNLANALMAVALQQKQKAQQAKMGQEPNKDTQAQGSVGSQPTTVTPSTQPEKPLGAGGSFISGLTGGKASSLGDLANIGIAKGANAMGMNKTASGIAGAFGKPEELGANVQAGQTLDVPDLGKIVITKSGPQGIEIDASQAPKLGVKKMTVDPKTLMKK